MVDLKRVTGTGEDCRLSWTEEGLLLEFDEADWPWISLAFPEEDISRNMGMAVTAVNIGEKDVYLFGYNGRGFWNSGMQKMEKGRECTLYVFQSRAGNDEKVHALFPRMRGKPGGYYELWAEGAAEADPEHLGTIRLECEREGCSVKLLIRSIAPFGTCEAPTEVTAGRFLPVVDRWGQYAHADWPDKVHSDAELEQKQREEEEEVARVRPRGWDEYGGWEDGPLLEATGHFRAEKIRGRWWLVDPKGRLFWSHGATGMGLHGGSDTAGREKLFPADTPEGADFRGRDLRIRMGGAEDWEDRASRFIVERLRSWGMNSSGAFMDPKWLEKGIRLPYCVFLPSLRRADGIHGTGALDKQWKENAENNIAQAAEKYASDPWCIGFYIDNEIHMPYSYEEWRLYYSTLSGLMRAYAPDTLYLGSRMDYHRYPRMDEQYDIAVRAAAEFCDVVSFNQYRYTLADLRLPEGCDRPVIIGEFHFGALDRGVLHPGLRPVKDQAQRAEAYKLFTRSALKNPFIVGTHWFTYSAQPTTGRFDGENYQIGLVDVCDTPYRELVAAIRETGYGMYETRWEE